jgi:hypothetical protein
MTCVVHLPCRAESAECCSLLRSSSPSPQRYASTLARHPAQPIATWHDELMRPPPAASGHRFSGSPLWLEVGGFQHRPRLLFRIPRQANRTGEIESATHIKGIFSFPGT